MQLLDSCLTRLLDALDDIAVHVQINSNFCISHPDYKPLELSPEIISRFQQLPKAVQNKYVSLGLRNFIYGIYYNGSYKTSLTDDTETVTLENNTMRGLNLEFYEGLHESNCGEGYFDPGWSVVRQESDDTLVVQKHNLTLHIKRDSASADSCASHHPQLGSSAATVGEMVAIQMPRNLLEDGFYVAVGNAGKVNLRYPNSDSQTVHIYFNFNPEGAAPVMAAMTQQLNEISIPFTFKVLYNPSDYECYDCGDLHFERSNYETVRQVLQTIYAQKQTHFRREIPLFTKLLAPGLSLAEEPDCKFTAQESFGMNRCRIVANGLLEAWQKGDDSKAGRMTSIRQHFSQLGIDLQYSYLNANSEDIYTSLD